jgi:hypothetical protein
MVQGAWFHILGTRGEILAQGRILSRRRESVLVQHFSFDTFQPHGLPKWVRLAETTGWRFFSSDGEMRAAYEAGQHELKRPA